MTDRLPARDLGDVRLAAAIEVGGCVLCEMRLRAESGTLDTIIAERVLDLGFRAGLERDHGFCRRHAHGLLAADRRSSGILGSSILFGAIVQRRNEALRDAVAVTGRRRRGRLAKVRARPPCLACDQGRSAVEGAASRLVERCADPAWAAVIAEIPFCLDDLAILLSAAADAPDAGRGPARVTGATLRPTVAPAAATPVAGVAAVVERQFVRLEALQGRLEGFADHSAQDRRHLLTDDERTAADEAARLLGGS